MRHDHLDTLARQWTLLRLIDALKFGDEAHWQVNASGPMLVQACPPA